MELTYNIDGMLVDFEISNNQVKEAVIEAVIRETNCTEEEANTFYYIASQFDLDIEETFRDSIQEYYEDEAIAIEMEQAEEDRLEKKQWNDDYLKSIKL